MTFDRLPFQCAALVFVAVLATPAPVWALDCFDLPEYARAAGTLEGLSTCDMTVEQARRVIAAHDGTVYQPQPPRHRRHRVPPPQPY